MLVVAPKVIEDIIDRMRIGASIPFADLANVCRHFFGEPRICGSHHVHKTPWAGNPRINIQNDKGKAKSYQVRQVLGAIDKLAETALGKPGEKAKAKKK
jgi:hypothetical protein